MKTKHILAAGISSLLFGSVPPVVAVDREAVFDHLIDNYWSNPAVWLPTGEPNAGDNIRVGDLILQTQVPDFFPHLPLFYDSTRPDSTLYGSLTINAHPFQVDVFQFALWVVPDVALIGSRGIHQAGNTLRTTSEVYGDNVSGYFLQTGGLHTVENDAVFGAQSTGLGIYLLNGPDAIYRVRRDMVLGESGTGALQQLDGSLIVQRDFVMGKNAGSLGVAAIAHSLDAWRDAIIGGAGNANLTLGMAGVSIGNDMTIGAQSGSVGTVTALPIANITIGGRLTIGDAGHGVMTLGTSTALNTGGSIIIGHSGNEGGSLIVQGGPGVVNSGADLIVGDGGSGSMNVGLLSVISAVNDMFVGRSIGGNGMLAHAGNGSVAVGNDLVVGGAGIGTALFGPTTAVNIGRDLVLGADSGGVGTVTTLAVADITIGGCLTIGNAGHGVMTLGTSTALNTGSSIIIGHSGNEGGSLIVQGGPGVVNSGADLIVGDGGSGSMNVGLISVISAVNDMFVGRSIGGNGMLAHAGNGSVAVGNDLVVGGAGIGTALFGPTTTVNIGRDLVLGGDSGGDGTMSFSQLGHVDIVRNLRLGGNGIGRLTTGGNFSVGGDAVLGAGASGNGTLNLTALQLSVIGITGALSVGELGVGRINLEDGALNVGGGTVIGGSGTWHQSGGQASLHGVTIGNAFTQNGGHVTLSEGFMRADDVTIHGFSDVQISGGGFGFGIVTQDNGSVFIGGPGNLDISADRASTGFRSLQYRLSGGSLTLDTLDISTGIFEQTGGNLTCNHILLGSGGTLLGSIGITGEFILGATAGTNAELRIMDGGSFNLSRTFGTDGGIVSRGAFTLLANGVLDRGPLSVLGGLTSVKAAGAILTPQLVSIGGGELRLENGGTLNVPEVRVTGGTLRFGDLSNPSISGPITLDATVVGGSKWQLDLNYSIIAGQTLYWQTEQFGANGSQIAGPGILTVDSGASVVLRGSGEKQLNTTLLNNGTVTWSGGMFTGTGSFLNNKNFNIVTGAMESGTAAPDIVNTSSIHVNAVGTAGIGGLTNDSSLDVETWLTIAGNYTGTGSVNGSGTVKFTGGGSTHGPLTAEYLWFSGNQLFSIYDAAANLSPTGTLIVDDHSLLIEVPSGVPYTMTRTSILDGTIELPGATALHFAADVTFGHAWNSLLSSHPAGDTPEIGVASMTVLSGSNASIFDLGQNLTLAHGSTANLGQSSGNAFSSGLITNHGTLSVHVNGYNALIALIDGGIGVGAFPSRLTGGGTLSNAADGTILVNLRSVSGVNVYGLPAYGGGTLEQDIENHGNAIFVGAATDNLQLSRIDGALHNFGTLSIDESWLGVDDFQQHVGTALVNHAVVRTPGAVPVWGGTLRLDGGFLENSVVLSSGSELAIGDDGGRVVDISAGAGSFVTVSGPFAVPSSFITGFQTHLTMDGADAQFFTAAAMTKPGGVMTLTFSGNRTDLLDAVPAGGTLEITNGFNRNGNTPFTVDGTLLIGNGSSVARWGNVFTGPGEIRVLNGGSMWFGGNGYWGGTGGMTVESGGTLTFASHDNDIHRVYGRTIHNLGTVLHEDAILGFDGNTAVTNDGLWIDPSGRTYANGNNATTFGGSFVNNGTFRKLGAGQTTFGNNGTSSNVGGSGPFFENRGIVDIQEGSVSVWQGGRMTSTSVVNMAPGTYLLMREGAFSIESGARFNGGALSLGVYGAHTLSGDIFVNHASFWGGQLFGNHALHGNWSMSYQANLSTPGTTTIASDGIWEFGGHSNDINRLYGHTFVNNGTVNHTWSHIGLSATSAVTNNGLWVSIGGFSIVPSDGQPGGAPFDNYGTFRKTGAGEISFGGVLFHNHGTMDIQSGGVGFYGSGIIGGTVNMAPGTYVLMRDGAFSIENGAHFNGGALSLGVGGAHTLSGDISVDHASFWGGQIFGNHTLHGSWSIGFQSNFSTPGTTTIASDGIWEFGGHANDINRLYGRTFVNNGTVNHTGSHIGLSATSAVTNNGLWLTSAGFGVFPGDGQPGGAIFDNYGTYRKTGGGGTGFYGVVFRNLGIVEAAEGWIEFETLAQKVGTTLTGGTYIAQNGTSIRQFTGAIETNQGNITLHGSGWLWYIESLRRNEGRFAILDGRDFSVDSPFVNTGTLVIGAGSAFTETSTLTNTGTMVVNGTLNVSGGISGSGSIGGAGSITGSIAASGVVAPGNSPGILTVIGDLTFDTTSQLIMELGGTTPGTGYDRLNVTGTFLTDGSLSVNLYNGFTPANGDIFDLYDASSITGTFDSITLPALSAGLAWDSTHMQSDGILAIVPEPASAVLLISGLALLARRKSRSSPVHP